MYGLSSEQKAVVDKAAGIAGDVLAANAAVTDREAALSARLDGRAR